ncbi:hypothetical protein [Mesorhizobium sp. YR577]|uniref:hypothetical protein n=1 Tax=Mesorhizobium sp. YR577 TaxID=1884373 RepID=UPI0008E26FFF|nr:hypothetical protein [Mesorhizobium sp. YR577]SFT81064.1 hypothetical protein SAMN05518861_105281 [Mesorhizobium sp. YR577]
MKARLAIGTRILAKLSAAAFVALLAGAQSASADMLLSDLRKVDVGAFPAGEWSVKKERDRLTIACEKCDGFVAMDLQLSRGPAGTESNIRSGKTTAKTMLDICKQNAVSRGSSCYSIKPANLKGAVGFVSDVKIADSTYAATYTIYQDGKLLLMRNIAGSRKEAARVGKLAFKHIAPQIVR